MASSDRGTFIGYPTDHLLAAFRDPTAAASAAAELETVGIPTNDNTVLRGDEGARRLDGTGMENGPLARARRLLSFTVMDQMPDLAWHERTVRDGVPCSWSACAVTPGRRRRSTSSAATGRTSSTTTAGSRRRTSSPGRAPSPRCPALLIR